MTRPAAALVAGLALAACSTGDGTDLDARVPAQTAPPTTTASSTVTASDHSTGGVGDTVVTLPAEPVEETIEGGGVTSVMSVPETGVPGLDADDAFCAAWARFGGSFQVIAVHAAFGDGTAESTARYELLAAPTVVDAYEAMRAAWPERLATESDTALDGRFGPLATRIGQGVTSLGDAGIGAEAADEIRAEWLAALSQRDPQATEVVVDLSADTSSIVDAAIDDYLDVVGPWSDDPTLVTDVVTPLTDEYLATACPDQGTLAGQEVG